MGKWLTCIAPAKKFAPGDHIVTEGEKQRVLQVHMETKLCFSCHCVQVSVQQDTSVQRDQLNLGNVKAILTQQKEIVSV